MVGNEQAEGQHGDEVDQELAPQVPLSDHCKPSLGENLAIDFEVSYKILGDRDEEDHLKRAFEPELAGASFSLMPITSQERIHVRRHEATESVKNHPIGVKAALVTQNQHVWAPVIVFFLELVGGSVFFVRFIWLELGVTVFEVLIRILPEIPSRYESLFDVGLIVDLLVFVLDLFDGVHGLGLAGLFTWRHSIPVLQLSDILLLPLICFLLGLLHELLSFLLHQLLDLLAGFGNIFWLGRW